MNFVSKQDYPLQVGISSYKQGATIKAHFHIEKEVMINEKHVMRFYFSQELKYYLENAGFEVLKICPFLDLNGRVDEHVWNIAVIARAVSGEV
ncbi:hypothetical protein C5S53_00590 [Methanophagales archaeon]|nr:hypothetical protein C5S53_00590 [Methanophagales archaeon]